MGGDERGGRGTENKKSGRNQGSGGGGGISTLDESITWDIMASTTDPPAYANVESVWQYISCIGCATTTLNDSSFKGSGAIPSKLKSILDL